MAIKHLRSSQTVELATYVSDTDKSTLWFEHSMSDNSKCMRPVTLISSALESNLSDPNKYGVALGSFGWSTNTNQRWFISPAEPLPGLFRTPVKLKVFTENGCNHVITIRNNKVVLAQYNPKDNSQAWYAEVTTKDENGFDCFALVNKSTGFAIQYPTAVGQPLRLVVYNPNVLDKSIMWSQWSLSDGYVAIGLMNDYSRMTWDAQGGASDGVIVGCDYWSENNNNQRWTIGLA